MPVRAALLALAVVSLVPTAAHARGPASKTFHHPRFSLNLPPGWNLAVPKPDPKGRKFVPAKKPRADEERTLHFADLKGNFFSVFVDRATDFEADATWTVKAGVEGAVEVRAESAFCKKGDVPSAAGPCSAGNGTLEISTLPILKFGAHTYSFQFGNTRREAGVNLELFRWILGSFRAK